MTTLTDLINLDVVPIDDDGYQKRLLRFDVFTEAVFMTRYDDKTGHPVACFEVSPAALASAFAGLPIATGLLPADTLFYNRSGDLVRMALFIPSHRYTLVSTTRKTPYRIPLPSLVWVGEGSKYWCYAVKQRPGADDRLYICPTPNVYNDGRVCQGNVPFPACSERTVKDAFKAFAESQFNTHLVGHKSREFDDDVMKLWRKLEKSVTAAEFPLDDLLSTNLKMSDLISKELPR